MKAEYRDWSKAERGFSLTELMIAMLVFTIIIGSVAMLLGKSQSIFRTEQGVSEMDQNGRLAMDFITRDIQQSKENGLGISPKFRSIYSQNGPEGRTDAITIVSADTETKIPSAALPLLPATHLPFSALDRYVELLPNGQGHLEPADVLAAIEPDEEFIVSSTHADGTVQFDFIKAKGVRVTNTGHIAIAFEPVEHPGVQPEIPFGSVYEGGSFAMRPVTIKRYAIEKEDKAHPRLSLSVNGGEPLTIARNVVAFQLRYLEIPDGQIEGQWVKEQNISRDYTTAAVEVTMTARTEIEGDKEAERLVTLASVIRPRQAPDGGAFGNGSGQNNPGLGLPTGNGNGDGSGGDTDGDGQGDGGQPGGYGDRGYGSGGHGYGDSNGGGNGAGGGMNSNGYNQQTRRIGSNPKLGQRLNPRP
ncbi:MAG TPA: prepilin-type N-terminal cleavage/methylation domain-containing protein [Blastocatellia bacterium]|nr:prepilin-type N-terminal cleavage/methylation domain-containing protein [Blastocatellia bacterium]